MGRPPLGPAKRSRAIAIHVTEAEYQLILRRGKPSIWARRAVLDALHRGLPPKPAQSPLTTDELTAARDTPSPNKTPAKPDEAPKPADTPHRHKRERVSDAWIGGQNVGIWRCATCGERLAYR